ncbi:hypothetical protein DPMN_171381 [Dreissena polymorpha]|uniref:Uncharacterized protein n=1 Tax=Dreissena polymorpha TaxID=45954 RepID=A0A9D4DYU2_DREPO|nr:hypothetical protein DPMN_171381 [Dreissena polymorpha]
MLAPGLTMRMRRLVWSYRGHMRYNTHIQKGSCEINVNETTIKRLATKTQSMVQRLRRKWTAYKTKTKWDQAT